LAAFLIRRSAAHVVETTAGDFSKAMPRALNSRGAAIEQEHPSLLI
jgi:hypothetical protein